MEEIIIKNKYDNFYNKDENKEELKDEYIDVKIKYYFNNLFKHNININKFNYNDYCYKLDNTKTSVLEFSTFNKIFKIKDRKYKKHYYSFIEYVDELNKKILLAKLDKISRILDYKDYNNKYLKFLRRINFDKVEKIFLIIYSDKKVEDDVIEYIDNIKKSKESFSDFIDIKIINLGI